MRATPRSSHPDRCGRQREPGQHRWPDAAAPRLHAHDGVVEKPNRGREAPCRERKRGPGPQRWPYADVLRLLLGPPRHHPAPLRLRRGHLLARHRGRHSRYRTWGACLHGCGGTPCPPPRARRLAHPQPPLDGAPPRRVPHTRAHVRARGADSRRRPAGRRRSRSRWSDVARAGGASTSRQRAALLSPYAERCRAGSHRQAAAECPRGMVAARVLGIVLEAAMVQEPPWDVWSQTDISSRLRRARAELCRSRRRGRPPTSSSSS